jgi:uncharacterized YccA/Bax inhibitor family protein
MSRYIQASIALEQAIYRRIRRIIIMRYSVAAASTVSCIVAGVYVWNAVYQYIGVFLEKNTLVYWKEILLSVTEALPFLATLALFTSVTLMLWSITHIYDKQKRYI